jgi:hypothetical protein
VERLPVMVTPLGDRCQPIAIANAVTSSSAQLPETAGRTLDIGGPDVVSYLELMRIMAEERGLRRRIVVPVPVLTPRLSSLWIHLVTPVSARIARPLAEGLRNRVVCRDDTAARLMPQRLLSVREAIRARWTPSAGGGTAWSDAGRIPASGLGRRYLRGSAGHGGCGAATSRALSRVGGTGPVCGGWLWRIRGLMDRYSGARLRRAAPSTTWPSASRRLRRSPGSTRSAPALARR